MCEIAYFTFFLNGMLIVNGIIKRNIVVVFYGLIFLFLVSGQAIQLAIDLLTYSSVDYVNHTISRESFFQAQMYYLIFLAIFFITSFFDRVKNKFFIKIACLKSESKIKELLLLFFLALVSFVLIFLVVGISNFTTMSRPGAIPGSTIFLVVLSVGLYPMARYLHTETKPTFVSILCFSVTLIVTMGFSRIHAIIYIIFCSLAWFFSSRAKQKKILPLLVKGTPIGFLIIFVFFGVGAIRDAINYVGGDYYRIFAFLMDNSDKSLLSLRVNYIIGVEGMSGLAGAFNYSLYHNVTHDFGLSSLVLGFFQWLPNVIKDMYSFVIKPVSELYFYQEAVVSPGIQDSYVSFGWFGAPIYALLCYVFFVGLPKKTPFMNGCILRLFCILFISLCVFFVRGSWVVWIGYTISYSIVYFTFSLLYFNHRAYVANEDL